MITVTGVPTSHLPNAGCLASGPVSFAGQHLLAAEIRGGRRVGIRLEPATMMCCHLDTRELFTNWR